MAYSSVMRYTGLSGIDTASMVDALMEAESYKYNKMYKSNVKYTYQQEAYQSVGNNLIALQKSKLDILASGSLRKKSTYTGTKTTATDAYGNSSSAISVTLASTDATLNTKIDIKQLAKSESVSFRATGSGKKTATSAYDTSKFTLNEDGSTSMNVSIDGTTKSVTLSKEQLDSVNAGTTKLEDELNTSLEAQFGSSVSSKASFGADASGNITLNATAGHTMKLTSTDAADALGFGANAVTTAKTSTTTMGDMFGVTSDGTFSLNGVDIDYTADMTVDSFISSANEKLGSDASISYNTVSGTFTIASSNTGEGNSIFGSQADAESFLGGMGTVTNYQAAQDAIVTFGDDPTEISYSSNQMTLDDGSKITFNSVTDGPISVVSGQDSEQCQSAIRDFVDMYNSLLTAIYDETKTKRPTDASGSYYDPLLESETTEMSATEMEKLEEKQRTGLLYKDQDLKKIEDKLRSVVQNPITLSDGTKFNLSDIGIKLTDDYSAGGLLEIDEEKFAEAFGEDGKYSIDQMAEAFAGYSDGLNDVLNASVGSNGTLTNKVGLKSSPLSLANNTMTVRIDQNQQRLADMLDQLAKKEDRYFEMFAYMEESINNSNAQLSALG